jgi:GrpB-like predicted nucleotidyltransferase (UPF0157 family)
MHEAPFLIRPEPVGLRDEVARVVAQIRAILPDADVHEVGSTAIPALPGKQDIDLLVRVTEAEFSSACRALDQHFPRNEHQFSSHDYQGYTVPSVFDVAIQATVRDGPHDTFLDFLDALRRDDALIARYAELKRSWHGRPMAEYRLAKARFIESVLR